jgi:hypothetical protein
MDSTAELSPQMVVSPTLRDIVPSSYGVYKVQEVWVLDGTTHLPIKMNQNITIGP